MLDIIIPSYNNEKGLYTTLLSLNIIEKEHTVYIIDDCSTDKINYDKIHQIFSNFHPIEIFQLDENRGPGIARQAGLDQSSGEYIMFIDCGDELINITNLHKCISILEDNPNINLISTAHFEEQQNYNLGYVAPAHNRMHGKIYRRSFLEKYNIRFNENCPRANEDIGFNTLCRMIIKQFCPDSLYIENDPIICWRTDENSIVRKNNCAFYFKEQNMGLAKNSEFILNKLLELNYPTEELEYFIYDIFCSLYLFYIYTTTLRPEFIKESLAGAKYFYNLYLKNQNINWQLFTKAYNETMKNEYNNSNSIFLVKIDNLTIQQFIVLMEENEFEN